MKAGWMLATLEEKADERSRAPPDEPVQQKCEHDGSREHVQPVALNDERTESECYASRRSSDKQDQSQLHDCAAVAAQGSANYSAHAPERRILAVEVPKIRWQVSVLREQE
jgi:hypothetical protein